MDSKCLLVCVGEWAELVRFFSFAVMIVFACGCQYVSGFVLLMLRFISFSLCGRKVGWLVGVLLALSFCYFLYRITFSFSFFLISVFLVFFLLFFGERMKIPAV